MSCHVLLQMMYLELTTVEEWGRRKRSYQEVCTKEMNEPSCCLYSLVVDFEAAGWDFVIAPKLYDAHMCSGECRLHHVGCLILLLIKSFRAARYTYSYNSNLLLVCFTFPKCGILIKLFI